jgi:hypothetical protein
LSNPIQHHYLPKSAYLSFFESEEKPDFIYFYQRDKEIVLVNTRKLAKERHLYSFTGEDGLLDSSIEQMLGDFEQRATPLLTKFNHCAESFQITAEEKGTLISFVSLQAVRVPAFRQMLERTSAQISQFRMQAQAHNESFFKKQMGRFRGANPDKNYSEVTDEALREFILDDTRYTVKASGDYFFAEQFKIQPLLFDVMWQKKICLLRSDECFITSDYPVVNIKDEGMPLNVGAGFAISSILFPLGKNACLLLVNGKGKSKRGMVDPDELFSVSVEKVKRADVKSINKSIALSAEKYLFGTKYDSGIKRLFDRTHASTRVHLSNPFSSRA